MITDVFAKDLLDLRFKRLFIFDMDGTLYTDGVPFKGSLELLAAIRRMNADYVFFTNNSSCSTSDYVFRLQSMGIHAEENNFCTSADAAAMYLRNRHPGELVYCMGTKSFVTGLAEAGICVTTTVEDNVDVVLLGYDTELSYSKIRDTCELLSRDVTYLATNMDLACPTSFGFVPDCGAIAGMIAHATGREPVFLGKPSPFMVEESMARCGATYSETVVVGDRLYTDIASGVNAGVDSVCVLTGEATIADIVDGDVKPTYTVESVLDILNAIS